MRFILDTSVYLAVLLDKEFALRAEGALRRIAPVTYLSSVVRAELTQGARGEVGRRLVARVARALEQTGRVVAPSHEDWTAAGVIQSRIWEAKPRLRTKSLLHDLLIAQSARRVGARVVTGNVADFELIHDWVSIEILDMAALLHSR